MSISPETRARYSEAARKVHRIHKERQALLEPTRARLWAAEEALAQIEEQTGPAIGECDFCTSHVFEGELHAGGEDGILCLACSPSYEDMLRDPGLFLNPQDEPLTAETAQPIIDAHLAAGGAITDKLVAR